MIALIPGLQESQAYLRPEMRLAPEGFAQALKAAAGSSSSPGPPPPPVYTVQPGDSLWKIARKLGLNNPQELARLNGLKNPDLIQVGQVLKLPANPEGGPAVLKPAPVAAPKPTPATAPKPAPVAAPPPRPPAPLSPDPSVEGDLVVASWYGPRHHGRRMANGRPFDMYADTVAHRSLPFGTRLKLTNPRTGTSVEVTVTDRGPYIKGRSLDVSYEVARKLGMVQEGVVPLRMEKI